jgi:hypothetical protein
VLRGEATNTNFIVFGSTRSGNEPTAYRTRGEHTNHYSTDGVPSPWRNNFISVNINLVFPVIIPAKVCFIWLCSFAKRRLKCEKVHDKMIYDAGLTTHSKNRAT